MEQVIEAFQAGLWKYAIRVIIGCIFFSVLGLLLWLIKQQFKKLRHKNNSAQDRNEIETNHKKEIDYTKSYQPKWLLSSAEKNAFRKIKEVTDSMGLTTFAKVRLFDLIEPKACAENYKGAQWKIQAKHVDFVICNQYLDAKLVIELDDSSHQQKDRKERDEFVNAVLINTGYTIVHANYINQEQLREIIKTEVLKETITT